MVLSLPFAVFPRCRSLGFSLPFVKPVEALLRSRRTIFIESLGCTPLQTAVRAHIPRLQHATACYSMPPSSQSADSKPHLSPLPWKCAPHVGWGRCSVISPGSRRAHPRGERDDETLSNPPACHLFGRAGLPGVDDASQPHRWLRGRWDRERAAEARGFP